MKSNLVVLFAVALVVSACAKEGSNSTAVAAPAPAATTASVDPVVVADEDDNGLDELDPFAADIEDQLNAMDQVYEQETGISSHISSLNFFGTGCRRETCTVWADVHKSEQKLYLYIGGTLNAVFLTSTGIPGRGTPNLDSHPNGRIYDSYTSTKFPGGDYNGLGNMPYAVFIQGGFAIHGTGKSNWKKLGTVASHGCVRVHPDNAFRFNRLVRQYGVSNVWVTIR